MNKSVNSQKSEEYEKNKDDKYVNYKNEGEEEEFDFNRPLYSDRVLV